MGGYPPPPKRKIFKKTSKKMVQKGLKLAFLVQKLPFLADFFLNGKSPMIFALKWFKKG